jgi:hypothetical protein
LSSSSPSFSVPSAFALLSLLLLLLLVFTARMTALLVKYICRGHHVRISSLPSFSRQESSTSTIPHRVSHMHHPLQRLLWLSGDDFFYVQSFVVW